MSRYLFDNNLSFPVLITLDTGFSGSGFFLRTKDAYYLITARHVLYDLDWKTNRYIKLFNEKLTILFYDPNLTNKEPGYTELNMEVLRTSKSIRLHKIYDVAVIKLGDIINEKNINGLSEARLLDGVNKLSGHSVSLVWVHEENTKGYEDVLISNEIFIMGYPNSLGERVNGGECLQINYKQPLLRKGIVAGKNDNNKTIILDCPAYFGNSGGMVLEIEKGDQEKNTFSVIGIVLSMVPFIEDLVSKQYRTVNLNIENSGYSIAAPMDPVYELVKDIKDI